MNLLVNKYLKDVNHNNILDKYNDLYESHPNYPSLLSISDSLSFLNIENISANVPFQHFDELPDRFLTKLNHIDDFILLTKHNNQYKIENNSNKVEAISIDIINQNWNGLVFIIGENENNSKNLAFNIEYKWLLYISIILSLFFFKQNFDFQNIFYLSTTLFGLYISYDILKTYFKKDNNESKFCSENKEISCNSVINSKDYKFNKYFEFVDLPILFFSISFLGILFNLFSSILIGFLSLLSFPLIIYSIHLQKFKIKKWCSLCLIASTLLIFNSIFLLMFNNLKYSIDDVLNIIIITIIITPIWFLLKNSIKDNIEKTQISNNLLRFKRSEKVLEAVSEVVNELENVAFITIGNSNAKNNLTLFITPSCSFCHEAIKDALQLIEKNKTSVNLKIGYNININNIDNPYVKIARIITYLFNNSLDYQQALTDWHIKKLEMNLWLNKWDSDTVFIFENEVLEKQLNWCTTKEFNYAPVRIFNNKLLSHEYEIKELHYFFIE
jgi:hypothetical protein